MLHKSIRCVAVLAVLLPCLVVGAQHMPVDTGNEETLRQLNNEWIKAFDAGDMTALDRIEDDSFTVAHDGGQVTKQGQFAYVRQRGAQVVTRKIEGQQVRFYGDVALLTETDESSFAEDSAYFYSTSVWVRRGDKWKVVHLHYSKARTN